MRNATLGIGEQIFVPEAGAPTHRGKLVKADQVDEARTESVLKRHTLEDRYLECVSGKDLFRPIL